MTEDEIKGLVFGDRINDIYEGDGTIISQDDTQWRDDKNDEDEYIYVLFDNGDIDGFGRNDNDDWTFLESAEAFAPQGPAASVNNSTFCSCGNPNLHPASCLGQDYLFCRACKKEGRQ